MMKCIGLMIVVVLNCWANLAAQKLYRPNFYSDEFKFQAWFPEEPKKEQTTVETLYGSSKGHRWIVELREVTFSVSVTRFSEPPVEAEDKKLLAFYRNVCPQLVGASHWQRTGYDMFGEIGASCGGRPTKKETISLHVFLVRDLLYVATAQWLENQSSDPKNIEMTEEFLETFNFLYLDKRENKMVWGLPPELSQLTVRMATAEAP